mgnify:CR=1 FL=1
MADKIVQSFNIFADTDKGTLNSSSNGMDYELNLANSKIDIRKGQHIKLSLINFSMYKSFTNVNKFNNTFAVKCNAATTPIQLNMPSKNYKTIRGVMEGFAFVLNTIMLNYASAGGSSANATEIVYSTPSTTDTLEGNTDNIIRFKIIFKNGSTPTNHNITGLKIQFFEEFSQQMSDAYSLLGGDRIRGKLDPTNNTNSYDIDESNPNEITFTSYYHAQRMTDSFVYLHHSLGGSSRNLETTSLNTSVQGQTGDIGDTHSSNILAKIPIDVEYIHFDSQTGGDEYFVHLYNMRHLNHIRFSLRTAHGVLLQDFGYSDAATIGNLNFNFVLRVDVIESVGQDEVVSFAPLGRGIDPKLSNQVSKMGLGGKY